MNDSVTAVWDELVQGVASRWQLSLNEAEGQMVSVIRHAIYDPALALVISTTGLLQMTPPPNADIGQWVEECHQTGHDWLNRYKLLEHHCGQENTAVSAICQCILSQLSPLFANSAELAQTGQLLVNQLPSEATDEAYDMLVRALTRLARISTELSQNDLSWLWEYINSKSY